MDLIGYNEGIVTTIFQFSLTFFFVPQSNFGDHGKPEVSSEDISS